MLNLWLKPRNPKVKSGAAVQLDFDVESTHDAPVQVTLNFPSPNASLSPHSLPVAVQKVAGSLLRKGSGQLTSTVSGKPAWYTLCATATDGTSETRAETLLSVTR